MSFYRFALLVVVTLSCALSLIRFGLRLPMIVYVRLTRYKPIRRSLRKRLLRKSTEITTAT